MKDLQKAERFRRLVSLVRLIWLFCWLFLHECKTNIKLNLTLVLYGFTMGLHCSLVSLDMFTQVFVGFTGLCHGLVLNVW